jgi:hypothetical protein
VAPYRAHYTNAFRAKTFSVSSLRRALVIPQPWSHSRLKSFKDCPRQFYEKTVAKSVREEEGEASIWGHRVHKAFEDRLNDGLVLPPELENFEPVMEWIEAQPGDMYVEHQIALNRGGQPCGYWATDVWYRGVIDVMKVATDEALIRDWKTGKSHSDYTQLNLFAIHTFLAFPKVQRIRAEYYWTPTMSRTGDTFTRDQMSKLWKPFLGDLRQYAEAFISDTWQPRQSGLCRGWCPVVDCEFWQPKRIKG